MSDFKKIRVKISYKNGESYVERADGDYSKKASDGWTDLRYKIYDLNEWDIDYVVDSNKTVSQIAKENNADDGHNFAFAFNGRPLGYIVKNEKLINDTVTTTQWSDVIVSKDNTVAIGQLDRNNLEKVKLSFSGTPLIVKNGQIYVDSWKEKTPSDVKNGRNPRKALGITKDNKIIMVTVDGRDPRYDAGLRLDELARVMIYLGAETAINGDGGGSCTFYTNGEVVNALSDGRERAVGSALLFTKKNKNNKSKNEDKLNTKKPKNKIKIALDAGHYQNCFKDTGAKGRYYDNGKVFEEHDFNADVVGYAKQLAEYNGFDVLLTQPLHSSNNVPLKTRTDLANNENVDLLFSFHANAGNTNGHGACIFYWHTSEEGKKLAKIWADKMSKTKVGTHGNGLHKSKPNSWTNLHMVRETKMTAVLAEHGFFTNDHDFKYILSDQYRKECAIIAVESICEYFGVEFKLPSGFLEKSKKDNKEEKEKNNNNNSGNNNDQSTDDYVIAGQMALKVLADKGIIKNPDGWMDKMHDNAENWMVFVSLERILERMNN